MSATGRSNDPDRAWSAQRKEPLGMPERHPTVETVAAGLASGAFARPPESVQRSRRRLVHLGKQDGDEVGQRAAVAGAQLVADAGVLAEILLHGQNQVLELGGLSLVERRGARAVALRVAGGGAQSAPGLRAVHRGVRFPNHAVRLRAAAGLDQRDAHAGAGTHGLVADADRRAGQQLWNLMRKLARLLGPERPEKDHELVAAEPGDRVGLANASR